MMSPMTAICTISLHGSGASVAAAGVITTRAKIDYEKVVRGVVISLDFVS